MSNKILISLDEKQLRHLADYAISKLLKDPTFFEVIDSEEMAHVAWRKSLLLRAVLENIFTEYFICNKEKGELDIIDDLPKDIDILDSDISWVNHVLKNNKLFPFMLEIHRISENQNHFFFQSNYTQIIEPETTKNSSN